MKENVQEGLRKRNKKTPRTIVQGKQSSPII